ncbi:MAG: tetratricopeptide repeat protein, partial [bacterium]|nr:tetratricopeptide repeat protein [bacterium]
LGRAYSLMGRYDQAIASLERGRELGGSVPNILGALGQTYALAGKPDQARRLLAELRDLAQKKYVTCSCFALIHTGLGENKEALDWLERGCERRELTLAALKVHPAYDGLRSEARFEDILRRIGLGP